MPAAEARPGAQLAFTQAGLRPTLSRLAVLTIIQAAERQIDAIEIFRRHPPDQASLPLHTIYRILRELVQYRLVTCENGQGRKSLFSAREAVASDSKPRPAQHRPPSARR